MTQFEQENDFGRGGGEVDDDTLSEAWENRERLYGDREDPADEADDVDEDVERRS